MGQEIFEKIVDQHNLNKYQQNYIERCEMFSLKNTIPPQIYGNKHSFIIILFINSDGSLCYLHFNLSQISFRL
ncbi:unnamed protein product [Paramecium octaurelia]|uniref:Uncharacterized protein n=1 Tax=Paramecium octaurelia TaxID=43137 RepID=A0A8S1WY66_PAROT|nr:unnamed protein product [Paramecium octaurelia]